jgi:hypothetical protein
MATLLLIEDDHTCYVRVHRIRTRERIRARLSAAALDRALARGVRSDSTAELSLRAHRLIGLKTRRALARQLLALRREAAQPQNPLDSRVPMCRRQVRQAAESLERLAERLGETEPAEVVGVAQVSVLLRDGSSPLFDPDRAPQLQHILHSALDALECAVPV